MFVGSYLLKRAARKTLNLPFPQLIFPLGHQLRWPEISEQVRSNRRERADRGRRVTMAHSIFDYSV